jgi:hypothetical protein
MLTSSERVTAINISASRAPARSSTSGCEAWPDHSANVIALIRFAGLIRRDIDHSDVDAFGRKVASNARTDLPGSADDYLHVRIPHAVK